MKAAAALLMAALSCTIAATVALASDRSSCLPALPRYPLRPHLGDAFDVRKYCAQCPETEGCSAVSARWGRGRDLLAADKSDGGLAPAHPIMPTREREPNHRPSAAERKLLQGGATGVRPVIIKPAPWPDMTQRGREGPFSPWRGPEGPLSYFQRLPPGRFGAMAPKGRKLLSLSVANNMRPIMPPPTSGFDDDHMILVGGDGVVGVVFCGEDGGRGSCRKLQVVPLASPPPLTIKSSAGKD